MNPISGRTALLGIIGHPVKHTASPAMHNAALAALGLDYVYVPLAVHPIDLRDGLRGLGALGFRGVNVTIPHKQAVMAMLDVVDPAAQAIGAVNTIVIEREGDFHRLAGYNTDWSGFRADLAQHGVSTADRPCIVLGAGGSSRAVVYALLESGATDVAVCARNLQQAEQLLSDLGGSIDTGVARAYDLVALGEIVGAWRNAAPLVVNTTPVGMSPIVALSVWPDDIAPPPDAILYDLIYNPRTTRLMRQFGAAGCRVFNGLGMLLQQGVQAFELWTHHKPDSAIMLSALEQTIG